MTHANPWQRMSRAALLLWLAGCYEGRDPHVTSDLSASALTAACAPPAESAGDDWTCPEPITVECADLDGLPPLLVASPADTVCDASGLEVSVPGSLGAGTHSVTVRDAAGSALCTTEITVRDSTAPTLQAHSLSLWPPNHKFHSIAVEDCVSVVDDCDAGLKAEFIWASSDEPVDDLGDGHHAPDIQLGADCQHVELRAERQGPNDGRVYRLGVRVMDGAGHATEGECTVIVDHDQRGVVGADSGEAYRIVFDGSQGTPACDGTPDEPPPPPPPTPPVDTPQNPD